MPKKTSPKRTSRTGRSSRRSTKKIKVVRHRWTPTDEQQRQLELAEVEAALAHIRSQDKMTQARQEFEEAERKFAERLSTLSPKERKVEIALRAERRKYLRAVFDEQFKKEEEDFKSAQKRELTEFEHSRRRFLDQKN